MNIAQLALFPDEEVLPRANAALQALVDEEDNWERRGDLWIRREPTRFTKAWIEAPATRRALNNALPMKELKP